MNKKRLQILKRRFTIEGQQTSVPPEDYWLAMIVTKPGIHRTVPQSTPTDFFLIESVYKHPKWFNNCSTSNDDIDCESQKTYYKFADGHSFVFLEQGGNNYIYDPVWAIKGDNPYSQIPLNNQSTTGSQNAVFRSIFLNENKGAQYFRGTIFCKREEPNSSPLIELKTTLSSSIDATTLAIPVSDTSKFPSTGYLLIDDERINYISKSPTQFTVPTGGRGCCGTNASSHAATTVFYIIPEEYCSVKTSLIPDNEIKLLWKEY